MGFKKEFKNMFRPNIKLHCVGGSIEYSGKTVTIQKGNSAYTVLIGLASPKTYTVVDLVWEEQYTKHRNLGKAVAGGVLGALVTPGVLFGAAVGGAIGGRERKSDNSKAILILERAGTKTPLELKLKCSTSEFRTLADMIRTGF